jgi:GTP-binding protein EngB required for normal cell division
MALHRQYREQMGAQLKEWGAQVNLLETKIDHLTADMKIMRAEEIQALLAKRHSAKDKMTELSKSSGENRDRIRASIDLMWADLKSGLTEAQKKFK